jgi:hypothetical protein
MRHNSRVQDKLHWRKLHDVSSFFFRFRFPFPSAMTSTLPITFNTHMYAVNRTQCSSLPPPSSSFCLIVFGSKVPSSKINEKTLILSCQGDGTPSFFILLRHNDAPKLTRDNVIFPFPCVKHAQNSLRGTQRIKRHERVPL